MNPQPGTPNDLAAAPPPAGQSAPSPERRGLECRRCGCRHFEVLYTRPGSGGRIMRRRACRHCGKRITTYERPA